MKLLQNFNIHSDPLNNVLTSFQTVSINQTLGINLTGRHICIESCSEQRLVAQCVNTAAGFMSKVHLNDSSSQSDGRAARGGLGGAEVSLMWFQSDFYVAFTPAEIMNEKRSCLQ